MKANHNGYFEYVIPEDWVIEEDDDTTSIYCNNGVGALILSYYSIIEMQGDLGEHISQMAMRFINKNNLHLNHALILDATQKDKIVLSGIGSLSDQSLIKLWVVAKYPKVVFATYICDENTPELNIIDKIVDSFSFN